MDHLLTYIYAFVFLSKLISDEYNVQLYTDAIKQQIYFLVKLSAINKIYNSYYIKVSRHLNDFFPSSVLMSLDINFCTRKN